MQEKIGFLDVGIGVRPAGKVGATGVGRLLAAHAFTLLLTTTVWALVFTIFESHWGRMHYNQPFSLRHWGHNILCWTTQGVLVYGACVGIAYAIDYAYAHNVVMVAAAADEPVTEQGDPSNVLQPSNTGQDLRINVDSTAATAITTDTPLAYAATDTNFGKTPNVVGNAYTNSTFGVTAWSGAFS